MTSTGSNTIRVPSPCTTRACGVCRSAGGELAIEFDRRHPPRSTDQLREDRRVVADAGADMYDMLPRRRRGGGDQRRMKRGLAVVQVALRQDADHVIGVQVNRVRIRRRAITAAPAHNLPRPGPEEVFPRHRGEGRLDPKVPDATGCHDLLCKGAPDDFSVRARDPSGLHGG
jgi:hypothetical protein